MQTPPSSGEDITEIQIEILWQDRIHDRFPLPGEFKPTHKLGSPGSPAVNKNTFLSYQN